MKSFLLLAVGLIFCITGFLFRRDEQRRSQGKFCLITGAVSALAGLVFMLLGIKTGMMITVFTVTFVMVAVWGTLNMKNIPIKSNVVKWTVFVVILLAPVLLGVYAAQLPPVTLDNGIIRMGGQFGGDFPVSDIQSIDTVAVYPKVGIMRGGSGFFVSYIGNFDVANEEKTAKLCFYRNKPPFISIRMKDNRLLLLNFYEPEKTIDFYRQLKDIHTH
jgi:hypothetical protein